MENGFIGGKKRCRRMYVQYLRVIPCILTLGILTSCGGNAEKEEEIGISTVAYTEEAAEKAEKKPALESAGLFYFSTRYGHS